MSELVILRGWVVIQVLIAVTAFCLLASVEIGVVAHGLVGALCGMTVQRAINDWRDA